MAKNGQNTYILKRLEERGLKVDKLAITVEETSHNKVTYEE